jgi:phenylacetate-CoA ligase
MEKVSASRIFDRPYTFALNRLILPLGDTLMGHPMMKRLRFLREAQWWEKERLFTHRDELLQRVISQAYEAPFYRDLMTHLHLKPSDIRCPEDLEKLPVITKDMMRAEFPDRITRQTHQKPYTVCSSGSTGAPFCVNEVNATAGWYRASFMLSLEWAGWRIGEPQMQTGMTLTRHSGRKLKDTLLRCHYVSAYDLTDQRLDRNLDAIEHHDLKHLWGYPGSLYFLARRALETNRAIPLRTIVTWGDMLYPAYRKTIETAFTATVTDTYGCAEGMQIASQCEGSDDYLIHSLDVIVEVLDDNDQPVPPGEPGNLVLTRLHTGATPFIRYKVGDIGILAPEEAQIGKRGFNVLKSIQGRDTDIVITPSGNRLIVHFFTGILEYFAKIDSFQVQQHEVSSITLSIVPANGYTDEVAKIAIAQLKERGADLDIHVELVKEIPLTSGGKRRFVISTIRT